MLQSSQPDRLSDASNMALFQARAAVREHGGTAVTDVHLTMGLLNAAPNLAPLLSPRLPVQRLAECLIGAIVSSTMPEPGAEIPLDDSVQQIIARGTAMASAPDSKVEPAHLWIALLGHADGAAVGCLRQVGVDIDAAVSALTGSLGA